MNVSHSGYISSHVRKIVFVVIDIVVAYDCLRRVDVRNDSWAAHIFDNRSSWMYNGATIHGSIHSFHNMDNINYDKIRRNESCIYPDQNALFHLG